MSNKQENDRILTLLQQYLDNNSEQRFCQALMNLGIIEQRMDSTTSEMITLDPFYTPNKVIIEKLETNLLKEGFNV